MAGSWTVEVYDQSVADELTQWPPELRARLDHIVARVEALGPDRLGAPLLQHVAGKIWEMRPSGNRVEGRALYITAHQRRVVILVAFIKKQQKTPRRYLDLAVARAKDV